MRIFVIGDSGVGKTELATRMQLGEKYNPSHHHQATIGSDYHKFKISFQNHKKEIKEATFEVFDSSGQERFMAITTASMKLPREPYDAIILCVDLSDRAKLFDSLSKWRDFIKENNSLHTPVMLVGTKLDAEDPEKQMQLQDNMQALEQSVEGGDFYYVVGTSAHTGKNVDALLNKIALLDQTNQPKAAASHPLSDVELHDAPGGLIYSSPIDSKGSKRQQADKEGLLASEKKADAPVSRRGCCVIS